MSRPIERKLKAAFCPYLVTAQNLGTWTPYRVYTAYSYLGEIFVLLAGFGLANPVMAFLSGGQGAPIAAAAPADAQGASTVLSFLQGSSLVWLSVALLVTWGLVKYYVRTENLEKRCSLLASYRRECRQIEKALRDILQEADPLPGLLALQPKLSDLVDRHIAEGSIPGNGIDPRLQPKINEYYEALIKDFSEHWDELPDSDRQQKKDGDKQ